MKRILVNPTPNPPLRPSMQKAISYPYAMLRTMLSLWVIGVLLMSRSKANADDKPNVLLIISDDQSFFDVGAYGNDEIATPNIDRLAERGVLFTHAYNMGAWGGAVCVASRTMLNSGRFLWRSNRINRDQWRDDGRFWSQLMQGAGYRTYFAGKWHVPQLNANHVFDVTRHIRPGMPNQTDAGYNRPIEGEEDPWSPYDQQFEGFWRGGTHWSVVTANDGVHFIEDAADRDEPFFMYVAFNAPHDPRQSPKEYVDRYPADEVLIPENYLEEYPHNEAMGSGRRLRDERLAPFPRTEHAVQVHRQEYYAIIEHMDTQIGRILDALEASGKAEDTVIIFTSDHGLAVGQHGLLGKQNMYEHSLRVPFIVTGPEIPVGGKIEVPIYLQDVVPTTLELAGAEVPDYVQFKSVLPLIRGERQQSYEAIYGAYRDHQRAVVVDNRHKLIVYPRVPKVRYFDLVEDPLEINDLAGDPAHRSTIKQLFAQLRKLQPATGDTLDLTEWFGEWFD